MRQKILSDLVKEYGKEDITCHDVEVDFLRRMEMDHQEYYRTFKEEPSQTLRNVEFLEEFGGFPHPQEQAHEGVNKSSSSDIVMSIGDNV